MVGYCETCGRQISPIGRYCSVACKRDGDGQAERECMECGAWFAPVVRHQRCCCVECNHAYCGGYGPEVCDNVSGLPQSDAAY